MRSVPLSFLLGLTGFAIAQAQTTVVPVTNVNWFFSPYSTYSDGNASQLPQPNNILPNSTKAVWTTPGSYFKVAFTGTSFSLNVSEAQTLSTNLQIIEWSLDGSPWASYTLGTIQNAGSAENLLSFAQVDQLSASISHSLIVALEGSNVSNGCSATDRWSVTSSGVPSESLVILSANLDPGASLVPLFGYESQLPKNALFLGDSITEGWNTLGPGSSLPNGTLLGDSDALQGWAYILALGLNAETGNIGHAGTGYVVGGADCAPNLLGFYGQYFQGASRLFAQKFYPMPAFVFINMGTNDGNGADESVIEATLQAVRAATNGNVPIFVLVPFGQMQVQDITTAATNLSATDPMLFLIDLGVQASYGLARNNQATQQSPDGLHPYNFTDAKLSGLILNQVFNVVITQKLQKLWDLEGLGNL